MGNWGTYHKKACKGGSAPVRGGGTTEKCGCQGTRGSSVSGNATLRVHNTTINAAGTLEAIATIDITKHDGGAHTGPITKITTTTLIRKDGSSELKISTRLQAGDILTLEGGGTASSGAVNINGKIIVTKDGNLGERITLKGYLDGTLNLTDDSTSNNIKVNKGPSLNATAPSALGGITVTGGVGSGLSGTATITISTTKPDHDLTTITGQVTITVTKLTKDKVSSLPKAEQQLQTSTTLANGDTLNLIGTANAGAKNLNVTGSITIGTNGGQLSNGLTFGGDVTGTQMTFEDAPDGVTVKNNGTLTLSPAKLTALQNTNFSLIIPGSDNKLFLTYTLVTKSKITLGTIKTSTTNVKLSGLSLVPVCITGGTGGFEATANLSLNHTQSAATLKKHTGQNIDLTNTLSTASVEITKGTVKNLANDDPLLTSTTLVPGDTLTLNISGGTTKLEGKITVNKSGTLTGDLSLKGGIQASNVSLQGGGGTLTSTGTVNISDPKYDHMEFHVNHQSDHCCYWGGKVFEWTESNSMTVWWHIPVVLGPFQICLAYIHSFILCIIETPIYPAL